LRNDEDTIRPAYWKFESTSLQQRVNKLSVPEEGYRSGRSTTLRVAIRENDPAGYDLLINATAAAGQQGSPPTGDGYRKGRSRKQMPSGVKRSPPSSGERRR